MAHHRAPGFVAVAVTADSSAPPDLAAALDRLGIGSAALSRVGSVELATWNLAADVPAPDRPLLLSATNWSEAGPVEPSSLGESLASDPPVPPSPMLPPYGAVGVAGDGVAVSSDTMGFRQLFRRSGDGWSAVSTSARALGALGTGALDEGAVGLQSVLGWQLGQRTLFEGVAKFRPGEFVRMGRTVDSGVVDAARAGAVSLEEATSRAAAVLRSLLEQYLDETPDPVLQLTGGQDSRLVLSAIPRARRKGLRVMTMGAPGTPDVDIAAHLAALNGMEHLVHGLEGLERLTPEETFARVCEAAARLDCMADPIAKAATLWAEEHFPQGPRLSGLGGELARGFYYTGRVRDVPVTRGRAERLARWRMFVNEAVEPAALEERFAADSRQAGLDLVFRSLAATGLDWYRATDVLYHDHRMQRWAGLSESAVCFDREIVNPMLDDRFRDIAASMTPADKAKGGFLARLQVVLDPDLAALPLDNRPPPALLAHRGVRAVASQRVSTLRRVARKVGQRVRRERRPPAGGAVLARKLLEHLVSDPRAVDPVRGLGIIDERWLDDLVAGRVSAEPGSLAFLVNLLVARGIDSPVSQ